MKLRLGIVLVFLVTILLGCVPQDASALPKHLPEPKNNEGSTVYIDISTDCVLATTSGKIVIDNYYNGGYAESPVVITNYSNRTVSISLTHLDIDVSKETTSLQPNGNKMPYTWLSGTQNYVTIQDSPLTISPGQSESTVVTLQVPNHVKLPDRWEFRIRVKNESQTGQVQTALDERYLVNMR